MWISCEGTLINLAQVSSVKAAGLTITLRMPSGPDIVFTYDTAGDAQTGLYAILDIISVQRID